MTSHTRDSEQPWLQLLGSVAFDLVRPRAELVDFETVATVLARVARFAGHTEGRPIYSVAQHSREGAYAILRDTGNRKAAAAFLAHDCHEYVFGDMATPIRDSLMAIAIEESGDLHAGEFIKSVIDEQKRRLDSAIYTAAGLQWPLNPETARIVKEYDMRMCITEARDRLAPSPRPWSERGDFVAGVNLSHWSESWARECFMHACRDLFPTCGGIATLYR